MPFALSHDIATAGPKPRRLTFGGNGNILVSTECKVVSAVWYQFVMFVRVFGGALVCVLVTAGVLYCGMVFSSNAEADKTAERKMDDARVKRGLPIIITLAVLVVLFVASVAIKV
jgi:heme/copper-type cytochrome/quinol oxidase subunit 2